MLRNIGIWNSFNFNAKKVAHPLGERPGARGSGPIPFNLVPRDLEKLGEVDHSESNNENVKKKKKVNKQRNNSAHAAHCFEHFFAVM